jgi:hypothetical protein
MILVIIIRNQFMVINFNKIYDNTLLENLQLLKCLTISPYKSKDYNPLYIFYN